MQQTLDAAFHLFTEKGYDGTTIADIAKRAGVSAGAVYRRFPDKDALLNAVADGYFLTRRREFDALADTVLSEISTARRVIEAYTRIIFSAYQADALTVRLFERRALVDQGMADRVAEGSRHVVTRIAQLLTRVDPRPLREIEGLVTQWHAILRGTIMHSILPDKPSKWPPPLLNDPQFEAGMVRAGLHWFRLGKRV